MKSNKHVSYNLLFIAEGLLEHGSLMRSYLSLQHLVLEYLGLIQMKQFRTGTMLIRGEKKGWAQSRGVKT